MIQESKQILRAQKSHLATEYGVVETGVSDPYVPCEQHPDSDIVVLKEELR